MDDIRDGEAAMDAYLKELHMEHIENYLKPYRHMIAEYDEAKNVADSIDAIEVVLREFGKQLTDTQLVVKDGLERLEALEKEAEDYKRNLE